MPIYNTEPVVQFNTWVSCDSSHPPLPIVRSPRLGDEHIYLEDVQTDEEKLNGSMLSSESTFLPFTSDLEPLTAQTDSEDETETFEADSLAPKHQTQSKKHNTNKTHHLPTVDKLERKTLEEVISGVVTIAGSQTDVELSPDLSKAEMKESPKQEEVSICNSRSGVREADMAAVKIQSWWRGQHTRCFHPTAREVRSEIRLRRMQEHILFLSDKLER